MNTDDFFASVNDLFKAKESNKRSFNEEKLDLKVGNRYLVRFLPYVKEGKAGYNKTTFPYQMYCWRGIEDGRWHYVQSPKTWGERCPISDFYFRLKDSPSQATQDKLKKLSYKRGTYYNVLVVDDPVNPENNGKVKVLNAGVQIDTIIKNATNSDPSVAEEYAEEFGVESMQKAMFDLSPNGLNFCIDVQPQGDFSNYKASRFVRKNRDLHLSKEEMDDIYMKCYDLSTMDKRYSPEEAADIFTKTFVGASSSNGSKENVQRKPEAVSMVRETTDVHSSEPEVVDSVDEIESLEDIDDYLNDL